MYPNGIPDPDRIGFIQLNALGHGGDFQAAIAMVCQKLGREPHFVDERGYEQEVTAASVDEAHRRMAWVECHSKESKTSYYVDVSFDLKVQVESDLVVDWEIETYNPYFGCQIELFYWMPEHLVVIYHEKHDTFLCSFAVASGESEGTLSRRPIARHEIADEWLVWEGEVIYRSETVDKVARRQLPQLDLLEEWSADHARSLGLLPPGYDEMNEIHRHYDAR